MTIPDYQTLMRPMLALCQDGKLHTLKALHDALCLQYKLTEEEIHRRIDSGRSTFMRNRIGWARTYLHKAGLLTLPIKAHCQITQRGQQALIDCPERIDREYLKQFEEFREFISPKKGDEQTTELETTVSETTPTERLQAAIKELNSALSDEVLESLKNSSPAFFEKVVVDIMIAMGYGGSRKEAGEATRYSNDGGIDGVIKEDPLGLDMIYLQAKRYNDKTIGRPEVQAFAGALDLQRARKGVFITTSRFSQDALEFVGLIEKKIALIDGPRLAQLMIEHNLGVSRKEVYEVKELDSDYFSEDE